MTKSYLDALRADAGHRCLGRTALKEQLRAAYAAPQRKLVMLVGQGGIGKSTLANWLAGHVRAQGGAVAWVSGEQVAPNPEAFVAGLRISSAEPFPPDLTVIGRRAARDLIVIDSLEKLRALLPWVVQDFLGLVGPNALVLLASRERINTVDRTDLGINDFLVEYAVDALTPDDALVVLNSLGVPDAQRPQVIAAARGLPLALRMIAERPESIVPATDASAPALRPDVLAALVEAFVSRAPSHTHVLGVYLAAIAQRVDEQMLAAICELDGASFERASDVFDWLGQTSIVERTELGISAHGLVRDVVFTHLQQRNPELLERIQARMLDVLVTRVVAADTSNAHQLLMQALYARRNTPIVREQLRLAGELELCDIRQIGAHNYAEVRRSVVQFEGEDSAASLDHWLHRPGTHADAIVSPDGKILAFQVSVRLPRDTDRADLTDPLLEAAWDRWIVRGAPEGDALHVLRWFIETESHQRFTAAMTSLQPLGLIIMMPHPEYRAVCCVNTPPEQWAPFARQFGVDMTPVDVEYVGLRWAISYIDLGRMRDPYAHTGAPIRNALRAYIYGWMGFAAPAPVTDTAPSEISRETFGQLLRRALNHLDEPQALRDPEMTALVGAPSPSIDRDIVALVTSGIRRLGAAEGTARHATILDVTYLRSATKQHAAAAELGIPFGTYRYQLRKAVAVLEDELWHARTVLAS